MIDPAESAQGITVSVIVPVHNGGPHFRRCLARLEVTSPPPFEIIVVAVGDTDGSGAYAERLGLRVLRFATAEGRQGRGIWARARREGPSCSLWMPMSRSGAIRSAGWPRLSGKTRMLRR